MSNPYDIDGLARFDHLGRRGLLARLASGEGRIRDLDSLVDTLRSLLNARLGESLCAPGYGIIDFADAVHNFPEAMQVLQQSIRTAILRYEPRLRNVTVGRTASPDVLTLAFEIRGRVTAGERTVPVRLHTELRADGQIDVISR